MNMAVETSDNLTPEAQPQGYTLYLRPCRILNGRFLPVGDREPIGLADAISRFAPSKAPQSRANVLRARRGHYIGLFYKGKTLQNFLIVNPTHDGDIRWLLRKNPDLGSLIQQVYLVDEVYIPRDVVDLPSTPSFGGSDY